MRRIHVLGAIILAIFSGPILAVPALETSTEARQILPRTLVPSRYALSLIPNPEALTFKGDVLITGTSPTAGRQIVMNANGLTFDEIRLDGRLGGAVALDEEQGRAMVEIAPGPDAPAGSSGDLLYIAGGENPDAVWEALGLLRFSILIAGLPARSTDLVS
jgi:aminopeptidase N